MLKNKISLLALSLAFFCLSLRVGFAFGQDFEDAVKELRESVIRKKMKNTSEAKESDISEAKGARASEMSIAEKQKEKIIESEIAAKKEKMEPIEIFKYEEPSARELLKQHYNLALAYDQNQQYDEAEAEYKKALDIDPDDPDTHYNLGIIYDDYFQDKARAVAHYEKYLELRPGARDAENVRSWIRWAKQQLALSEFK